MAPRWYTFTSYSNTFQRWSHMPHGSRLCTNADIGWIHILCIYGTASFSLRTNSLYVGIFDISALACFSNTLQRRWHTALCWCWCWCWLNTYIAYILWNGVMLALDKQWVRWYCWYAHLPACQTRYDGDSTRLCADANVDWIYIYIYIAYVLWNDIVLALDEQTVRVYWCRPPQLHTCLTATQLQRHSNNASCWCWCWLNTYIAYVWNDIVLTLDEQPVRWYCW